MDIDSLVYNIKTKDFYADFADDVPERFDTSGYASDRRRPLKIGLNKKVIGLIKDELGGTIMTDFIVLRPKLYSYKVLDGAENKSVKELRNVSLRKP